MRKASWIASLAFVSTKAGDRALISVQSTFFWNQENITGTVILEGVHPTGAEDSRF